MIECESRRVGESNSAKPAGLPGKARLAKADRCAESAAVTHPSAFLRKGGTAILPLASQPSVDYAANLVVVSVVTLRTASDMATRVMPLKIMLTPTRVPMAQAELEGHCS
jgi:hypothetical protein